MPEVGAATSPERATPGQKIYLARCSGCHKPTGTSATGPGLRGILKSGRHPEAEVRKIIMDGKEMMPAFRGRLTPKDLDDLIEYLKTL
jgi:mono/diheme cytochrome c family protein